MSDERGRILRRRPNDGPDRSPETRGNTSAEPKEGERAFDNAPGRATKRVETDEPCGAPRCFGPCPGTVVNVFEDGDRTHAWCTTCGGRRRLDVDGDPVPWLGWEGVEVPS